MTKLTLREVVQHPATIASAVVATIGGLLNLPVLSAFAAVAWAKAGTLFTVLSIGGFTVAPRVEFLPEGPLTVLALGGAGLYVLKLLYGVFQNLDTRL
jgi:hypothetical protein